MFPLDRVAQGNGGLGADTLYFLLVAALLALLFGGLSSYLAVNRGRSPAAWFLIGAVFNIFGILALYCRPKNLVHFFAPGLCKIPTTASPSPCPNCGALNHPLGAACSGCHSALNPAEVSEARLARSPR